jgi:hypothetical protein
VLRRRPCCVRPALVGVRRGRCRSVGVAGALTDGNRRRPHPAYRLGWRLGALAPERLAGCPVGTTEKFFRKRATSFRSDAPPMTVLCLWCGQPFERRLSGGSPRRFCSSVCRAALHTAARKWALAEIDAGRLSVAAIKECRPDSVHAAARAQVGSGGTPVSPPRMRTRRKRGGEET